MRPHTRRRAALIGAAAVATLMWPGPASADTDLGGYSGLAQAQPVRIQIYEPIIPIPATPQIDGGIAFTRSNTDTGPVSRALASYLWPGDTVGDGFGALVGSDKAKYPVQVNSRFPATPDSPANNTAQLTDGNGMTTSSNESVTKATVTGLGVTGTNVVSNPLKGLGNLLSGKPPASTKAVTLPVPTSSTFAGLVSAGNVTSDSTTTIAKKSFTATAHAAVSDIKLLGGLVTIGGVNTSVTSTSDGKKATTSGSSTIGAVSIAGMAIGLSDKGISLGGSSIKLPAVPGVITSALEKLGISVTTLQSTRAVDGASGLLKSTGMVISIDTAPLRQALNVGGLTAPLSDLLGKIPKLGSTLAPLLGIGPKIVLTLGSVEASALASPAYTGGGSTGGSTGGGSTGGGSTGGGSTGGGSVGGGSVGGTGDIAPVTGGAVPAAPVGTVTTPVANAGFNLPALGAVPKFLILAALLLAGGIGWVLRTGGAFLLGAAGNCEFGLASGVPNMRAGALAPSDPTAPTGG